MANTKSRALADACAALPNGEWRRLLGRAGLAGLVAVAFVWLLANRLSDIPLDTTRGHLFAVTGAQWLTAILATAASFWAVGHYDGVIHRYLATGARASDARRAGATAIAVSQTLGLGVITGAILRWRMLPDQTLWQATKITALVAMFFLGGWAIVTASVLVALPTAPFKPLGLAVLAIGAALILTSAMAPKYRHLHWPNLFIIARLIVLTALDTLTAALALWALCPPDLALPVAEFLPAFLLAFGAGLISGAPGGIGAFEITLLALLPAIPETQLLAAILAWRMVYFAAPALIGAGLAIRGPMRPRISAPAQPKLDIANAGARAEAGLLAQGQLDLIVAGRDQAWLSGRTAHCLIGLLDPLIGDPRTAADGWSQKRAVTALIDTAQSECRQPVIYKCTARTAVAARQLGLKLRPVAREAWLDPRAFALATPSRAGLRRKLRRAAAAGITVTTAPVDWEVLAQINTEWAACHGGEQGFSMGRFDRGYLSGQRLYVALLDARPVAFVSFHVGKNEWTLDLMRHVSSIPDGTMHGLLVQAIADAARQTLPRLSLSAVPFAALNPAPTSPFGRLIHSILGGRKTGLTQFKSAFVPHWQTLYIAAPHKFGLAIAGVEIAREVLFPPAIMPRFHHHHDEYEIATAG